jgi:hypothetical protein
MKYCNNVLWLVLNGKKFISVMVVITCLKFFQLQGRISRDFFDQQVHDIAGSMQAWMTLQIFETAEAETAVN